MRKDLSISELVGKTLKSVTLNGSRDEILFETNGGEKFQLYHRQDCCEYVSVDDICGELSDLIGSPILKAEDSTNSDNPKEDGAESFLWTFYRIATAKGQVVIRWYGSSNGYYSESVSFCQL